MKNNKRSWLSAFRSFGRNIGGLIFPSMREEEVDKMAKNMSEDVKIETPTRAIVRKFFQNPFGVIGLIGFIAVFAVVFIGSALIPFDPYYSTGTMRNIPPGKGYMNVPSKLLEEGVEDISTGITFSVGLSKAGNFYYWGVDPEGVLDMPKKLEKELEGKKIKQVAAGDRHILLLTEDDQIYGWGNNAFDQTKIPADIKGLIKKEGVEKIGAGDQYSVLLTKKGNLRVWGSTLPNRLNRIPKEFDNRVADFRTGSVNILLKTVDNELRVIGSLGSEVQTALPKELHDGKVAIKDFARMQRSGAAIDEKGELYVWGSTIERAKNVPQLDSKIVQIVAGRSHFTALTESGRIYSWGNNEYGEGTPPDSEGFSKIFAGFYNNYALKGDNELEAWGVDGFLIGTDDLGRDVFTRLIHGGKATLQISFIAVVIQIVIGVAIGMISGFYGGRIDNLLMRFTEIVASFPFYPTIITLSAIIPPNTGQYERIMLVMVLLGILSWSGIARLVRGQILAEREKDYITAARALGLKEGKIIMSHILPNILSIVIVQATLGYAGNLLSEAGLSFLGFGVVEPFPSWGNMLTSAQTVTVIQKFWWRWIFPGITVFLTAFTVNLIGDALRDAVDPKTQER